MKQSILALCALSLFLTVDMQCAKNKPGSNQRRKMKELFKAEQRKTAALREDLDTIRREQAVLIKSLQLLAIGTHTTISGDTRSAELEASACKATSEELLFGIGCCFFEVTDILKVLDKQHRGTEAGRPFHVIKAELKAELEAGGGAASAPEESNTFAGIMPAGPACTIS